jgi:hypothetical protein
MPSLEGKSLLGSPGAGFPWLAANGAVADEQRASSSLVGPTPVSAVDADRTDFSMPSEAPQPVRPQDSAPLDLVVQESVSMETSYEEAELPSQASQAGDLLDEGQLDLAVAALRMRDSTHENEIHGINAADSAVPPPKSPHGTSISQTTTRSTPTSPVVAAIPQRSLGKRPSPWREPRLDHQLPPPAKDIMVDHSANKKQKSEDPERAARRAARKQARLYAKLFSDTICVHIPMSVTADLGMVLQRQREKRVAALYQHFPELKEASIGLAAANKSDGCVDEDDKDDGVTSGDEKKSKAPGKNTDEMKKKLPKLKHVPQPHEYASVIDYLEAKYVQGVVIHDDDEAMASDGHNDEGNGSVYSETSFLDDSGLQRTVAEQVLGHQTTTKLEMMGTNHDDDGFFVNVGDLEVEETDMTREGYDPLDDTKRRGQGSPLKKKVRKQKPKPASPDVATPKEVKKKELKADGKATSSLPSSPTKKDDRSLSKSIEKKASDLKTEMIRKDPTVILLKKESDDKKAEVDIVYGELVAFVKGFTEEELPRKPKPKRTKVTVTIPLDQKKETIVFANPLNPGQRITAKIPPNLKPGDSFKVMVRGKQDEEGDDDDTGKDHNKLSREFYDKLEDYSRMYDEWCDAEGVYRRALGGPNDKSFQPHLAKRQKFDQLVSEFPKDMKTPADKEYLKKILRRARQNKHKREQTLARQLKLGTLGGGAGGGSISGSMRADEDSDDDGGGGGGTQGRGHDDDGSEDEKAKSLLVQKALAAEAKRVRATRTIILPELTTEFETKTVSRDDFKERV